MAQIFTEDKNLERCSILKVYVCVILPFGPEPFSNELPSGLTLRVEDKAELLTAEGCFLWLNKINFLCA